MPEHVAPPSPAADAPPGLHRMARDPSAARAARWRNEETLPHGTAHALGAVAAMLPALRLLVGLLIAALVIAALYFGRDILIPLALAVLLGFLLDPAVSRIKRWGLPRMAATLLVVAIALGGLGGMGAYLTNQVSELSADLPTYQSTIRKKLRNLRNLVKGPSMWDGAIKTYDTVEKEISVAAGPPERVQKVEIQRPDGRSWEQVLGWLAKISAPIATAGIVLLFVILILLDRDGLRDRLLRLMGGNLHVATDALDEASERIGSYLRMQFIVNVTYGFPMAVGLWFIGVPGAVLWGVLATVMRFVPYVGPMISAIFPLALAFAVAPGWEMLLWTLGLILLLELLSNNVIEPWLYGSSTGLSTLSIILAATFWTALWGPIGLILSTPLTVCLLVLGRYIPSLQFMEVLLGSEPVLDLPHRLYQRLLADDVEEAVDLAVHTIEAAMPERPQSSQHSPATRAADRATAVQGFYDSGGISTLRLVSNHYADVATAEHRLRLSSGLDELLEELYEAFPPPAATRSGRVHCVGARWDMDALAAQMAAHSLALHGYAASHAGQPLSSAIEQAETAGWQDVRWLVLSVLHPQPQAQVRFILRRLRRLHQQTPRIQVVLALWNAPSHLLGEGTAQRLGVQAVVTSVQELVLRLQQLEAADGAAPGGHVPAALPDDEAERLQALHASGLLQHPPVRLFHDAAQKAAHAFGVKYAQVSLVDRDWVHTPGGLLVADGTPPEQAGLPRDQAICSYVVHDHAPVVVNDVARDPRFADNPVLAAAQVRFYAGVPLVDGKGRVLGSLCILHDALRGISPEELTLLGMMAQEVMAVVQADAAAAPPGAGGTPPLAPPPSPPADGGPRAAGETGETS